MNHSRLLSRNVRQTSLIAYEELQGSLGQRQAIVYNIIIQMYKEGKTPATDREITREAKYRDPNKVRPRRNELVGLGYVAERDKRKCQVTGKTVLTWDLSQKALLELKKKGIL
jgi:hypothetical protein